MLLFLYFSYSQEVKEDDSTRSHHDRRALHLMEVNFYSFFPLGTRQTTLTMGSCSPEIRQSRILFTSFQNVMSEETQDD